ncbi:SDR family NAD(P)-dependent oxidoreductase [Spirosoma sp. HMF4905]|uniref:SDR family NAD(P)-dependent oxidoreductase n=2 Tax=Spirosoma arboris TaxID=2682092 RepID=A0A7K1SFE2_9BACT|nr:SDR family NAD(P)-dependent oxidoreductase [Spirosoma arboris]
MNKKVILITGTSSGFGWLTALSCVAGGHRVYATMRDPEGRNQAKARALGQQGNVAVLNVDVTDVESVNCAVASILEQEGKIDVVVNNAGLYATGIAETFTEADMETILNVDLKGPWRLTKAVLPSMRQQRAGLIINVSSVAGRFSFPFQTVYNTAKFALEGLTEGLYYEVRPLGVDVVMVQPGPFPTEMFGNILTGSDVTVIASYGELAKVPGQIGAGIEQLFASLKPDPQLVADAIIGLIDTPAGERPLRTVVDPATGQFAVEANDSVQKQYEQFMAAFGMQALLS